MDNNGKGVGVGGWLEGSDVFLGGGGMLHFLPSSSGKGLGAELDNLLSRPAADQRSSSPDTLGGWLEGVRAYAKKRFMEVQPRTHPYTCTIISTGVSPLNVCVYFVGGSRHSCLSGCGWWRWANRRRRHSWRCKHKAPPRRPYTTSSTVG